VTPLPLSLRIAKNPRRRSWPIKRIVRAGHEEEPEPKVKTLKEE